MRTQRSWFLLALPVALLSACDTPSQPEVEQEDSAARTASVLLGRTAFIAECASCHASRDGFDLAFFSFPDTTIVRRAVAHVDSLTAFDIVAYIESLDVPRVDRHAQSFQPGGVELDSDVAFAAHLFGSDQWPEGLTSAGMRAIDPTDVPVAFAFPQWSFEESNVDWMPDMPLPDDILGFSQGAVGRALDMYYRTGTDEHLSQAVIGLRTADRHPDFTPAPCLVEVPARFDPETCFEVRRWTSSLVAQHMLRNGETEPMSAMLHDSWWDVGNAARKSLQHGMAIDNPNENWAVWMYMGWAFAPERHASVYLATGLHRIGLDRHGTFAALRAQVVRPEGRGDAYKDLSTAVRFAPEHWVEGVARFGYQQLLERLEAGDVPDSTPFRSVEEGMPESHLHIAYEGLMQARAVLQRRLGWQGAAEFQQLHDRVTALLPVL